MLKATVIYPSTQAADGIKLARLLVAGEGPCPTWSRSRCPQRIVLNAPVVTKDNVDQYIDTALRVLTDRPGDRAASRARSRHPATRTPGALDEHRTTAAASRVGMVGYAFMGAAHSQAWRTAPRFFDLPLHPETAGARAAATPAAVAEAADRLGWAVDRDRLAPR